MDLSGLISARQVFFITGKGGTGKSTLTSALGIISSKRYKTLIVDFDNKRSTQRELLKVPSTLTEPQIVNENLSFSHIEPEDALRYYLRDYLKRQFLINMAMNLRPLRTFYNALPSAKEMLISYFLIHLVRDYNFEKIFIDMPASGHAELFLKIPHSAKGIFSKGPVLDIVNDLNTFIYNKDRCGVIQTSLPEEVVVEETVEFFERFNSIENVSVVAIFMNKVLQFEDVEIYMDDISEGLKHLYNYYLMRHREEKRLIKYVSERTGSLVFEAPMVASRSPLDSIVSFLKDR